jgi:uncharacterized protein
MTSREFNPLKLDLPAFAHLNGSLSGQWPLQSMPRLEAGSVAVQDVAPLVEWQAQGEERKVGGARQVWVRVSAQVKLALTCQRCLLPVQEHVATDRWIRFVESEDKAAELDAELEDDVLVLSHTFDLRWLVEDELILALPLAPKHPNCSALIPGQTAVNVDSADPLPQAAAAEPADAADQELRQRPFADLADLIKRPKGTKGRKSSG